MKMKIGILLFIFILFMNMNLICGLSPVSSTWKEISFKLGGRDSFEAILFEIIFDEEMYVNGSLATSFDQTYNNNQVVDKFGSEKRTLCMGPSPNCMKNQSYCNSYSEYSHYLFGLSTLKCPEFASVESIPFNCGNQSDLSNCRVISFFESQYLTTFQNLIPLPPHKNDPLTAFFHSMG